MFAILAFKIIFLISTIKSHKCVHSEMQSKIVLNGTKFHPNGFSEISHFDRLMQSSSSRTINIVVDYSKANASADQLKIIQTLLSQRAIPRLQQFLKVTGTSIIPAFNTTFCDSIFTFPSSYASTSTTADLIIVVRTINEDSSYLAYGTVCDLDPLSSRPNKSIMTINMKNFEINSQNDIEQFISTLIHEMTHILAFSPTLFPYFPNPTTAFQTVSLTTLEGTFSNVTKITTPSVVAWAKTQFGCQTVNGLYLEDEGNDASSGTHWEKTAFGNEMMTSFLTAKPVLSGATLSLIKDSTWYQVNMNYAEDLTWGKDDGCGFLSSVCNTTFVEFCNTANLAICSPDFVGKSFCKATSFSDKCFLKDYIVGASSVCNYRTDFQNTTYYENTGVFSRCFDTKITGFTKSYPGCYKSSCLNGIVQVVVKESTYNCTSAGQIIQIDSLLNVTCPDPVKFCSAFSKRCLNDCSGNGKCLLNGECFCNLFYSGVDCSTNNTCTDGPVVCAFSNKGPSVTTYSTFGVSIVEMMSKLFFMWSILTLI